MELEIVFLTTLPLSHLLDYLHTWRKAALELSSLSGKEGAGLSCHLDSSPQREPGFLDSPKKETHETQDKNKNVDLSMCPGEGLWASVLLLSTCLVSSLAHHSTKVTPGPRWERHTRRRLDLWSELELGGLTCSFYDRTGAVSEFIPFLLWGMDFKITFQTPLLSLHLIPDPYSEKSLLNFLLWLWPSKTESSILKLSPFIQAFLRKALAPSWTVSWWEIVLQAAL